MHYVIGIDGGQTSTTAVLADETGRLLGVGHGGPANHIHEPGGVERVRRSLTDAITSARTAAGLANAPIACAYLGMTGGSSEMEEVCRPVVDAEKMVLGHDSLIALYSVTFGKPGVVVIGGTGSVGFGRNEKGETARAGGWGYVFGDEGSAYWIAVEGLRMASRALDRIDPPTDLLPFLCKHAGATDLHQIHRMVYSGQLSRPDIGRLAVAVWEAAESGDVAAMAILSQAGWNLGLLAVAVFRKLDFAADSVEVGTVGGVFKAGEWVMRSFRSEALAACPNASIVSPRVPAAVAAALLALEEIGRPIDDELIDIVQADVQQLGEIKS
jgi:N-acetylglucosamine kinase-like BadF-type ATPase